LTAGRAQEEEELVRRKCAWCGRDLGVKEASPNRESGAAAPADEQPNGDKGAEDTEVTSTICPRCAGALAAYRKPVLVVSREWARMYEDLVEMLKERPDIQIVIDRRQSEGEGTEENGWKGPERRRKKDPFTLK
jgi:hypothetical protein